jgi:para-nitrobenzyl esterase
MGQIKIRCQFIQLIFARFKTTNNMNRVFALIYVCLVSSYVHGGGTVAERYRDIVFSHLDIDSVAYGHAGARKLWMDVYQPAGDTAALRPLVIMAHGGSFMHGSRTQDDCPAICRELALRGYVAVSIDYRLTSLIHMVSRAAAYRQIIRAAADGRASIRWFLDDIARGNHYRVDQRKIFFGGTSAGAILAEQLAYIDSAAECRPLLRRIVQKQMPDAGRLPEHCIHGVISLAGALLDTSLIGRDQPALLHIHGDADRIVPYGFRYAINGWASFRMAGLQGSRPRYISQHLDYSEYVFLQEGHTPWYPYNKQFNIVMEQITSFLYREIK